MAKVLELILRIDEDIYLPVLVFKKAGEYYIRHKQEERSITFKANNLTEALMEYKNVMSKLLQGNAEG